VCKLTDSSPRSLCFYFEGVPFAFAGRICAAASRAHQDSTAGDGGEVVAEVVWKSVVFFGHSRKRSPGSRRDVT
jgi:hypothetical protein